MDSLLQAVLVITLFVIMIIGVSLFKKSRDERKENKKLELLNKNLTVQDANKNEFLSFATHQLRSPLTSIKWGLGALKENPSSEMIDKLLVTTDDLIGTVNDLLDISKIDQGGMVMKFEEFDIHDFLGRIVEEFRQSAEKKNLHLAFIAPNESCFVKADENKLRQVLVNLIDNSIKYTKAGDIQVSLKKSGSNVHISVSDTGSGIAPEELKDLFDKFVRGAAGKASQGGSGLGLYLAKRIMEQHKGDLIAASPGLGKGSVFTVVLPLKAGESSVC